VTQWTKGRKTINSKEGAAIFQKRWGIRGSTVNALNRQGKWGAEVGWVELSYGENANLGRGGGREKGIGVSTKKKVILRETNQHRLLENKRQMKRTV